MTMPRKNERRVQTYDTEQADPAAITPIEYGGLQDRVRPLQRRAVRRHAAGRFHNATNERAFGRLFLARPVLRPRRQVWQARNRAQPRRLHRPDSDEQIMPDARARDGAPVAARVRQASSRGYHNKEWAAKMKAIGLMPSNNRHGRRQGNRPADDALHHPGRRIRAGLRRAGGHRLETESAKRASRWRQEGAAEQGEVHLPGLRIEHVGQAGFQGHLRRVQPMAGGC